MAKKPAKPKGRNTQYVYEAVRERIINMEFRPGASIDEARLVRLFGVSRTPIREALVRLASDGLVILLPNRGAMVAALSIDTVRDYIEAMDVCQRAVVRLAAIRRQSDDLAAIEERRLAFEAAAAKRDIQGMNLANHDFHAAVGAACHNAYLAKAYHHLLTDALRLSWITLTYEYSSQKVYSNYIDSIIDQHRGLAETIAAQDTEAAEALGRAHVELARQRFIDYISQARTSSLDISTLDLGDRAGQRR